MNSRLILTLTGSALAILAVSGCAGGSGSPGSSPTSGLATADSSLGEIIVDGDGMTVYVFDNDTPNSDSSACTGNCVAQWPAVTTESETPDVEGVTGEVGTAPSSGGARQITINGLRIYTFANDSGAGDTNGQGVNGTWWAVSPDGEKTSDTDGGEDRELEY